VEYGIVDEVITTRMRRQMPPFGGGTRAGRHDLQDPDGKTAARRRLGMAIDARFAGDSDSYGAESPCVVKTPGGYLMVYGGSDGEISRLHMATSEDSHRWDPARPRRIRWEL
jgi:hypothetical protein